MTRTSWTDVRTERLTRPAARAGYELARASYDFGARVRDRRLVIGMTQAELAEKLHTSQSAIARLEAGGTQPRPQSILALSHALGIDWSIGQLVLAALRKRDGPSDERRVRTASWRARAGRTTCSRSTTQQKSAPGCCLESRRGRGSGQKTSER